MRPLIVGTVGGLALAAMLLPTTTAALGRLAAAREAEAATALLATQPVAPPLPAERVIRAPSAAAAEDQLAAMIRRLAGTAGVLVEAAAPVESARLARVGLRLSGSEAAVLGLADRLERGTPVVRFTRWQVEGAGGGVRLTGEVAAPWR